MIETMSKLDNFKVIGIFGKPRDNNFLVHQEVFDWLKHLQFEVYVETSIANYMQVEKTNVLDIDIIGAKIDLAIVIGGDGNMLSTANKLTIYPDLAIVGINKGNLGFLTDINPENVFQQLSSILYDKNYFIESRFLYKVKILQQKQIVKEYHGLNEVAIHPTQVAKMFNFDIFIDQNFAFSQKADGFMISTPTGSTAYSLSAGGPILHPQLDAITLVFMYPHILSARPIVVKASSIITVKLNITDNIENKNISVSCDGNEIYQNKYNYEVIIQKSDRRLNLIHLNNYNYYNVLTSKLGWLSK